MPTLYLTKERSRASLTGERLHVEIESDTAGQKPTIRDIPFHEIERLFVEENSSLSTPALCECLRREIPITYIARDIGPILGQAVPVSMNCEARMQQYKLCTQPEFALAFAISVIDAKIANSRRVLQRLGSNRPQNDTSLKFTLDCMENDRKAGLKATNLDAVRGHEGVAAGRYFEAYAKFYPPDHPFERRSRRPPHNVANSVMSFAYSLLVQEAVSAIYASGLDPCLGFLHQPQDGRASLALDMIEPFRAPVGDALAIDLISHAVIKASEHTNCQNGGVYLNRDGRLRFYYAYERRMDREFTSEQTGLRTTLRREIQRMALSVKASITRGEILDPFIMN